VRLRGSPDRGSWPITWSTMTCRTRRHASDGRLVGLLRREDAAWVALEQIRAGTTLTRRLDETHRSGPARSQLHCVRGVAECSGFCERVVCAEAICLSRGDVLRLSLTTGRSSSLLGRPSPLVLLDAHLPGAACADGPGWGITYARFRFFGWPSRGRWQRGPTVRQNAGQCPLSRRQALAYGNSQVSVAVVPPKAVTANAFRTRPASIVGAGFRLAEPSGDASTKLSQPSGGKQ
jgi:hypothetical protein